VAAVGGAVVDRPRTGGVGVAARLWVRRPGDVGNVGGVRGTLGLTMVDVEPEDERYLFYRGAFFALLISMPFWAVVVLVVVLTVFS
jgi:hypothetical protein